MHTLHLRAVSIGIVILAAAVPAAAQVTAVPVAAQVSLNQSKATKGLGGCDAPGFPLTICEPGSYILTGGITATAPNQTLISMESSAVTIDLNGFRISGNCGDGSTGSGGGIRTRGFDQVTGVTVINGIVSCMGGFGIFLSGDSHRVERVTATRNRLVGIWVDRNSILMHNVATANESGIQGGFGSLVRSNVLADNSYAGILADGNTLIGDNVFSVNGQPYVGGISIGNNLCNLDKC